MTRIVLYLSYKVKRTKRSETRLSSDTDQYYHLIQLPVFNEEFEMVRRLVHSACNQAYPNHRTFIQLLDDSDAPRICEKLRRLVENWGKNENGRPNLYYYHRKNRDGFKAGNLNYGLQQATELFRQLGIHDNSKIIVSVFDADFVVPNDYLLNITPSFEISSVGAVQAAYAYENEDWNWLTRAQSAFSRNLHIFDFSSRSLLGWLSVFRGSGGSLRLSCIEAAGFWQGDTQIEDVDLSMAVQIEDWRIVYLDHVYVQCQLPASLKDMGLQQRSWMKGLMEVMKKRITKILKSRNLNLIEKYSAIDFFFLLSLQPLFIVFGYISIIPYYHIFTTLGRQNLIVSIITYLLALFVFTNIPFVAISTGEGKTFSPSTCLSALISMLVSFFIMISMFVPMSIGLVEGLIGVEVHRDRTIKHSSKQLPTRPLHDRPSNKVWRRMRMINTLVAFYSTALLAWSIYTGQWVLILMSVIFAFGTFCWPVLQYLGGEN